MTIIEGPPKVSLEKPSVGDEDEVILTPEIRAQIELYRQKFAPHIPIENPALARAAIRYAQTQSRV